MPARRNFSKKNVFRSDDEAREGLLRDPYVSVRLPTFLPEDHAHGPTDALGFRNAGVPNRAEVVAIGDSHTFGTGTPWPEVWPTRLARELSVEVAR